MEQIKTIEVYGLTVIINGKVYTKDKVDKMIEEYRVGILLGEANYNEHFEEFIKHWKSAKDKK